MMRMETRVKGRFQVNVPSRLDTAGQEVEVVETPLPLGSSPGPGWDWAPAPRLRPRADVTRA